MWLFLVACDPPEPEANAPACEAPAPPAEALWFAGDNAGTFVVPDGRTMSPAGTQVELGGFPADLVVVEGFALVTNAHRSERSLQVIRVALDPLTHAERDRVELGAASGDDEASAYPGSSPSALAYDMERGWAPGPTRTEPRPATRWWGPPPSSRYCSRKQDLRLLAWQRSVGRPNVTDVPQGGDPQPPRAGRSVYVTRQFLRDQRIEHAGPPRPCRGICHRVHGACPDRGVPRRGRARGRRRNRRWHAWISTVGALRRSRSCCSRGITRSAPAPGTPPRRAERFERWRALNPGVADHIVRPAGPKSRESRPVD